MRPSDLVQILEKLQAAGLTTSDFGDLHHFSLKGRCASLPVAITYFQKRATLRGNNISLAKRCRYVADRVKPNGRPISSLIAEALEHHPFDNSRHAN